ncbi:MAG: prolipoprotein diacylglyceryl transferase [Actinomycetota bacterium]|nr:prolipoprotein diacylglyceryl transferase [Actinomycetota bacterium]
MLAGLAPTVLPSPTSGVWHLGFFPVRGYAMCILAGIVVAVWITQKRLADRGGREGLALDISAWAVPFGILGGRIYHLITSPQAYFGEGGHPLDALKIWNGGLGIWGAVALGAVGALIGCRRHGISLAVFGDCAAPGILVAQGIGRWGNWFNNEIYGGRTDLPWGLQVYQWDSSAGHAVLDASGQPVVLGVFQPTFLYESLFVLALALAIVVLDRRVPLRPGQVLALYIAGYPLGRVVLEFMRTDDANHILGLRVNVWVSLIVFLLGAAMFVFFGRRSRPAETETPPQPGPHDADAGDDTSTTPARASRALD